MSVSSTSSAAATTQPAAAASAASASVAASASAAAASPAVVAASTSLAAPLAAIPLASAPLPVLIVGGGLAGLVLARALSLAHVPWLLFERSSTLSNDGGVGGGGGGIASGTGIGLWGPAEALLDRLDLPRPIQSLSLRMGCAGYRTQGGAWLAQQASAPPKGDIRSCLTLMRGELQELLLSSLPADRISLNSSFVSTSTDGAGVVSLTLSSPSSSTAGGTEKRTVRGSLLVGADGVHSAVRGWYYPSVKPRYEGYAYWRAVVKLPEEAFAGSRAKSTPPSPFCPPAAPASPSASASAAPATQKAAWSWPLSSAAEPFESWGPSTRAAFVPLPGGEAFWFVSRTLSQEQADLEGERVKQGKAQGDRSKVFPALSSGWHSPISSMLSATPLDKVVFTPIHSVVLPPGDWACPSSRVIVLGDAAHAVPPNLAAGGMASMCDAVELASRIRPVYARASSRGEGALDPEMLQHALQSYVAARKNPVRVIQACSALVAAVGQLSSPSLCWARDRAIRLVPSVLRNWVFQRLHRFYLGWTYTVPSFRADEGLYERFVPTASEWARVPGLLRAFHSFPTPRPLSREKSFESSTPWPSSMHHCRGEAACTVGPSFLARVLAKTAGMPPAMPRARVVVAIAQRADGSEVWLRTFCLAGDHPPEHNVVHLFPSTQYPEAGKMVECVSLPFTFDQARAEFVFELSLLRANGGEEVVGFEHTAVRARVRLFPCSSFGFALPLPSWATPVLRARTRVLPSPSSAASAAAASKAAEFSPAPPLAADGSAYGWSFVVSVSLPDSPFTRAVMGRSSEDRVVAGYAGRITAFTKPEVLSWIGASVESQQAREREAQHATPSSSPISSLSKSTPAGSRAFSTLTRSTRVNSSKSNNRAWGTRRFSSSASASTSTSTAAPPPGDFSSAPSFNILLLGAYGLFGNRLAGGLLLYPPGLGLGTPKVFAAARRGYPDVHREILDRVSRKARVFYPASSQALLPLHTASNLVPLVLDSSDPSALSEAITRNEIRVVVNCVGPFQRADYSCASTCARLGVNYIDLADAREFVSGFAGAQASTAVTGGEQSTLDSLARVNGATMITGASSVPGLSSAAVRALMHRLGLDKSLGGRIDAIDIGISPGNHTPRGLATMQSILSQLGTPIALPGGASKGEKGEERVVWTSARRALPGMFSPSLASPRRWLSAIDVPDLSLFPGHFAGAQGGLPPSMQFRAGLENPVMHWALVVLAHAVRLGLISPATLVSSAGKLKALSESPWLMSTGSDTGGMYVSVAGKDATGKSVRAVWRLYAGSGEGLQIPATAAVVLCSKLQQQWQAAQSPSSSALLPPPLPVGAYPCLSLFTVDEFMAHLRPFDISADIVVIDEENCGCS